MPGMEIMRTTMLCCNRVFEEQGISRLIASFHKDLLAEDISSRLAQIGADLDDGALNAPQAEACKEEFVRYIEIYANNYAEVHASIIIIYMMCKDHEQFAFGILECTVDIYTQSSKRQMYPLGARVIEILGNTLWQDGLIRGEAGDWHVNFMGRLLDAGCMELLNDFVGFATHAPEAKYLDYASKLLFWFLMILFPLTDHRHGELLPDMMHKFSVVTRLLRDRNAAALEHEEDEEAEWSESDTADDENSEGDVEGAPDVGKEQVDDE